MFRVFLTLNVGKKASEMRALGPHRGGKSRNSLLYCFKRERKAEKDEEVRDILSSMISVFHKPLSMPVCPNWEEYFLPSIKLLCYDLVKFIDQCLQLLGGIFRFSCVMMSPGDTILTFGFYAIYFFFLPYYTLLKLHPSGE